jgi:pimeloyl-ACP methyl ester carboxylesterase
MPERRELMPSVAIEPRVIQTARGIIEYDLTVGNGPVVLCVHAGLGGCDQARVLLAWLNPADYRLLSPSRPGYLGTPLESGASMEDQADLLAALLDELKIDRVLAVGPSAGGPPLYTFAMRHPDRVRAIVPIDAVSGYYVMPETAGPIAQAIFLTDIGQKIMQKVGAAQPKALLKSLFEAESYFSKEQIKAHSEWVIGNPDVLAFVQAFMATMMPYKLRKPGTDNDMKIFAEYTHLPLERVTVPTLVIHGTHDSDVKLYDGVYAHEHIAGSERFWIEEGSHLGFWISPNGCEAQRVAREFLARHAG